MPATCHLTSWLSLRPGSRPVMVLPTTHSPIDFSQSKFLYPVGCDRNLKKVRVRANLSLLILLNLLMMMCDTNSHGHCSHQESTSLVWIVFHCLECAKTCLLPPPKAQYIDLFSLPDTPFHKARSSDHMVSHTDERTVSAWIQLVSMTFWHGWKPVTSNCNWAACLSNQTNHTA